MSSDSSSSSASGDDPTDVNPNSDPKLVDERFGFLTLTEPVGLEHNHRENGDGIDNGSLNQERINDGDEDDDRLRVENEEMFGDEGPLSPSSSGYAAERGSSSATSASRIDEASEIDDSEIQVVRNDGSLDEITDSQASSWVPGKRHVDEDDASISWRKRKKHFFILSNSGKPIYSRYGDEHKLAGFSATLQAIISFVENGGDRVKLVKAGKHQVVFLVKGPIYLVCISCTEEPFESLKGQLELIYGQMILILTKSINRCFEKNPKFDMTPLLGGTDVVFSSLIHSFSWNPATFLHAYTCLPLAYATRQSAGAILQDVADSGVLFAILMCKHKVDTYLMLLTTSSDAFHHLKDCRIRIEMVVLKSNVLSEVQRSMIDGGMHVEDLPVDPLPQSGSSPHLGQQRLPTDSPERPREPFIGIGGPAGLWHFIYRSIYLDQYVSSEFSPPLNNPQQQKRLYRAYQRLYASMHVKGIGPHKTQFRRDEICVLLCWVTQDFELYAAFDPLADKVCFCIQIYLKNHLACSKFKSCLKYIMNTFLYKKL
ncbi:vacuolar fusion protein MON1 homolog isoform X4 [Durio zibethinus]|uniref:Vacuolar fusion protein MON1 homolog n=1 Tax=Durio zibethinus TaxID=66656 RepID=A0A6P5ZKB7_DURZI|nr:vacuolar fusion protein MON1 homolog isoform X4 [Durio zibethinus]